MPKKAQVVAVDSRNYDLMTKRDVNRLEQDINETLNNIESHGGEVMQLIPFSSKHESCIFVLYKK